MASSLRELEADPALYIYTSLTAGSSHIVTATSRLETILRANRIPFKAVDMATNDKARMLWGRRAGKDPNGRVRKLPALVQEGFVVGDIVEIEEWNEYGELKQHVTIYQDEFTQPPIGSVPPKPKYGKKKKPAAESSTAGAGASPAAAASGMASQALPMRTLAEEAAAKAKKKKVQAATKATGSAAEPKRENKEEEQKEHGNKEVEEAKEKEAEKPVHEAAVAPSTSIAPAAAASKTPKAATGEEGEDAEAGRKTATTATPAPTTSTPAQSATKEAATTRSTTEPTSTTNPIPIPTHSSSAQSPPPSAAEVAGLGLQSPTSGGWKDDSGASRTVQSPTSTTWQPTDVDAPITSLQGALIESATDEEIKEIERAETIKEVPDEEVEE
ncbi:hypothetical protein GE21DRAFT_1476 [Neurospora crassa]|uniref:Uncharacterized protein n=1 Tax=Neurospora crassa (strain ATCC 24698 / 74-OR23-1A / CBS 708.71 / DSM 1257 / FGSC 987) TaxID=367110 RepID=Q7SGP1_NEUCR|nr:hypothetical protein NCU08374 [Neurospora crassa OR74A]EAA36041.1 hypothetical protein NCU08374 [Neurospora crassa OR74A]KHE88496.1 hypothetical protein GE21DRAFT_1476 [Neurospora crassa]|eukprot:XP_965277.1 hypothetical protein NCU08374 [Neurospora crassa OR74A]